MSDITFKKFTIFILGCSFFLPFLFIVFWPDQKTSLIACNVGQGDAILLTKGFTQVLIDGGPNQKVLDCLNKNIPFWDREIELVVNTHPDKDHLGGLVDVINRYQVKKIIANSQPVESKVFQEFHQQVLDRKIPVYSPHKGDQIKVSGLVMEVLWPSEKIGDSQIWEQDLAYAEKEEVNILGAVNLKPNDYSIVLHLRKNDFDILLTGDITDRIEKELIKDNQFHDIEVLKVAHHGSKYSSCLEFLKAVNPGTAIISVGKNPWGHPTPEVLERLRSIGAQILRTDQDKIKITF